MNPPLHKGFTFGYEKCPDYLDGLGEKERGPRGAGRGCGGFARIFWWGVEKEHGLNGLNGLVRIFLWCVVKEPAWRQIDLPKADRRGFFGG